MGVLCALKECHGLLQYIAAMYSFHKVVIIFSLVVFCFMAVAMAICQISTTICAWHFTALLLVSFDPYYLANAACRMVK